MVLAILLLSVFMEQEALAEKHERAAYEDSMALYYEVGLSNGKKVGQKEGYARPLVQGMFYGYLVGMNGVAVLVGITQGNEPESAQILEHKAHAKGPMYLEGFKQGYREESRKIKFIGRLLGGIAGTAITYYLLDEEFVIYYN